MKIFIYVENEDMTDLKPVARRIEKKTGSQVNFYALKFMDPEVRADLVLTLPQYEETVRKLFEGRNVPIRLLEDEEEKVNETPDAQEPTIEVLVVPEVEPEPEAPVELPPPQPTDEIVVMTVTEDPAPAAPARRRSK